MALEEHVMFSYEVPRDGVQTHAQHGASKHIENRLSPQQPVEQDVKGELEDRVGHLQLTDGFGIDVEGSDGIKQRLQNYPDEFAEARAEEPAFKLSGNINIHPISSQVAVMIQVISFEGRRIRKAYGQVGKHGKVAVPHCLVVSKGSVVGDFMNSKGH